MKDLTNKLRSMRERRTTVIDAAKNRPCMDCGGTFPSVCMDFDHVRGEKLFGVGNSRSRSVKAMQDEIAKCDIVCANCHRVRTHARRQYRKTEA